MGLIHGTNGTKLTNSDVSDVSDVSDQMVPVSPGLFSSLATRGIEVILERIEEVQIEVSDAWRCGWWVQ